MFSLLTPLASMTCTDPSTSGLMTLSFHLLARSSVRVTQEGWDDAPRVHDEDAERRAVEAFARVGEAFDGRVVQAGDHGGDRMNR